MNRLQRLHRLLPSATLLIALAASATPVDDYRAALGAVFAVDEPAALAGMRALPADALDPKPRAIRNCMIERFDRGVVPAVDPALPPDLRAVLEAFRRYWTSVLMKRVPLAQADAVLSRELGTLLPGAGPDLDARADAAVRLAESRGWHALGGVTAPLHEFMLWKTQATHREHVALPEGPVDVDVIMLDDFASYGWGAWGTCDAAHSGGWTDARGIWVVASSWDLASEAWRVSLLAHESQHFADNARFPKLDQTDLEYRAKLVELALAHDSQATLLAAFSAGARRDRSLPHPFAQWWVMARLGERLGSADWHAWPADAVRAAAVAELRASTAALSAKGAATVRTALPD
jgi:hypothetical protein